MIMTRNQTYLAFDYGLRRIGVAIGNSLTRTARPLQTISWYTKTQRDTALDKLIKEWQPTCFILGLPIDAFDREHEMTRVCRNFGVYLTERFKLPVEFVDERYTSQIAESETSENTDAYAATLILEQYLNTLNTQSNQLSE
jgi:putative Holliday junction resolvase